MFLISSIVEFFRQWFRPRLLSEAPAPVPGRPGMFVRALSQLEWEQWMEVVAKAQANNDAKEATFVMADLVQRSACKRTGRLLFAGRSARDVAGLMSRKALSQIYDAARTANRITAEDLDAEKKDSGEKMDPAAADPAVNGSGSSSVAPTASPLESARLE